MSPRLLTALTFKIVLANVIVFQRALGREKSRHRRLYNPYPPGILPSDLPSEITGFKAKFEASSTKFRHGGSRCHR